MKGSGNQNLGEEKRFKIELKHWVGALIVGVVAGLVIFGMLRGQEFLASFLIGREAKRVQEEFERPYKEDKYGGKTPEQTFDMFLAALRKGDIDLASKYFELEKQEDWGSNLQEIKNKGELYDFIFQLEGYRESWALSKKTEIEVRYTYEVKEENQTVTLPNSQRISFPGGIYKYDIVFIKILSGIWKISIL